MLPAFCNTLDLHLAIIGLEIIFFALLLNDHLRQVLLYNMMISEVSIFVTFDPLTSDLSAVIRCSKYYSKNKKCTAKMCSNNDMVI